MKIKKILFPTDFSDCAAQALPFATFFSREFKSDLHMLHSIDLDRKVIKSLTEEIPDVEKIIPAMNSKYVQKMDALI
jgi:nucleotide-binding universal stress UspA family protein